MGNFNSLVLQIAIIILIISLVMIGWGIYQTVYNGDAIYPVVKSACPDYWDISNDKNIKKCKNTLKLGKGGAQSGDPNCDSFNITDFNDNCSKLKLSNVCQITWDGISDNNKLSYTCYDDDQTGTTSRISKC